MLVRSKVILFAVCCATVTVVVTKTLVLFFFNSSTLTFGEGQNPGVHICWGCSFFYFTVRGTYSTILYVIPRINTNTKNWNIKWRWNYHRKEIIRVKPRRLTFRWSVVPSRFFIRELKQATCRSQWTTTRSELCFYFTCLHNTIVVLLENIFNSRDD